MFTPKSAMLYIENTPGGAAGDDNLPLPLLARSPDQECVITVMVKGRWRMAEKNEINGTGEGPQHVLEQKYVREYLLEKGYHLEDLAGLPQEKAQQLMREACQYATLKLAEVEAKGHFRKKIHF